MILKFEKYQGAGNDFVMIDDRNAEFDLTNRALIAQLCDRKFGIGADGLLVLRNDLETDFRMIYFNADGGEVSFCGNGARCIVHFAHSLGIFKEKTIFRAEDGVHKAGLAQNGIYLKMIDVQKVEDNDTFFITNTGVPHYVTFRENLDEVDIVEEGRNIRNSERFREEGVNVNFVQIQNTENYLVDTIPSEADLSNFPTNLAVRTYERGVEDETLACGTGITACALVYSLKNFKSPISIQAQGGILGVWFERTIEGFQNIYLVGGAEKVFQGEIQI